MFRDDTAGAHFSSAPPGAPVRASDADTVFDPAYTLPALPADLVADAAGVHGVLPRPGTALSPARCGVDWTNARQVAAARADRLDAHLALADEAAWVDGLREAGESEEGIARKVVELRNDARLARCAPEALPALFEHNLAHFGTRSGPSYEFQLAEHGSPAAVIAAGHCADPSLDVLTGIAVVKPA